MKCSRCGADIHTGEKLCPGCGMEIKRIDLETSTTLGKEEFPSGEKEQNKNKNGDNPGVMKGKSDSSFDPGFTQAPDYRNGISGEEIPTEVIRNYPEDGGEEGNKRNKKRFKVLGIGAIVLVLLAVAAIVVVVLNRDTFTEEDARALVKAQLDSDLLGEYDDEFEFSNQTREEVVEEHSNMLKQEVDQFQTSEHFTDSLRGRTEEMCDQAFRHTNYTVGKATALEDGSFTVRVTVKPLDLYAGMDGMFYRRLGEKLQSEQPEIFEEGADDSLYFDALWNAELDQIIDVNLKNPTYQMEEYQTVRLEADDQGIYEANTNDLEVIYNKLFYYDSRWQGILESES